MNRLGLNIEDLMPHRGRMLLIDAILDIDDKAAVTRAKVTDRWPFFDGQAVSSLILIELVAQTAGINNSWVRIKKRGQASEKKGWLVGIKQSRFFVDSVGLGDLIVTQAENQFEYESYRHVSGIARIGDVIVGEVSLQLFQTDSAD